jgi:hypothetical protein
MPLHDWTKVDSGMYHDFHQSWSIRIKDVLNSGLLPKGVSALVDHKTGEYEADVLTIGSKGANGAGWGERNGTATLTPPSARIVQKSTRERYAELANRIVIQQRLGHTLAVIEIVSPGNKDSKRKFDEFIEKSRDFIANGIHLMVIDPFPPTKRDPNGIHRAI